jgi:hypothetical protein
MESEPSPGASQLAVFVATTAAGLNVLFYLASGHYYAGRPDAAALGDVRIAFAALTIVVGAAAIGARVVPRAVGHGLGVLLGLATFAAGIAAASSMPPVMTATLLVVGALMPVLAWRSLTGSRPAWSFLISLLAVFAAVTFFGAPKIRTLLGIGLWTALIVPGLQIAAVCALAMTRRGYAATR